MTQPKITRSRTRDDIQSKLNDLMGYNLMNEGLCFAVVWLNSKESKHNKAGYHALITILFNTDHEFVSYWEAFNRYGYELYLGTNKTEALQSIERFKYEEFPEMFLHSIQRDFPHMEVVCVEWEEKQSGKSGYYAYYSININSIDPDTHDSWGYNEKLDRFFPLGCWWLGSSFRYVSNTVEDFRQGHNSLVKPEA